jgi:predicted MFS family arabinose efflux permease
MRRRWVFLLFPAPPRGTLEIAFEGPPPQAGRVNKLCIFVGSTVGGYVGWYLFDKLGMMPAFIASGIGSVAGVYFGWKLARKIEE